MSSRRTLGAAVAILLALATLPSSAAARGGERLELRLHTRSGYEARVRTKDSTVAVVVERDDRKSVLGFAGSAYITRGEVGAGRLRASFGDFGHVRMRFLPHRRSAHAPGRRGCGEARRSGTFVGSFRFDGEDGYVRIRSHRVRGAVVRPPARRCRRFPGPRPRRAAAVARAFSVSLPVLRIALDSRRITEAADLLGGPPGDLTLLRAGWRQGVTAQSFAAVGLPDLGALYFAQSAQSEGRLAILRVALGISRPATFSVADSLRRATVKPPAPFSGSAVYRRFDDGGKSWSGTLAISFPGASNTPLVGAPFETKLIRGL